MIGKAGIESLPGFLRGIMKGVTGAQSLNPQPSSPCLLCLLLCVEAKQQQQQ